MGNQYLFFDEETTKCSAVKGPSGTKDLWRNSIRKRSCGKEWNWCVWNTGILPSLPEERKSRVCISQEWNNPLRTNGRNLCCLYASASHCSSLLLLSPLLQCKSKIHSEISTYYAKPKYIVNEKNKRKKEQYKRKNGKMNLVGKIGKKLLHYLFFISNINGLI
jgi:hypothetical protein